jgi:hypothetical protein
VIIFPGTRVLSQEILVALGKMKHFIMSVRRSKWDFMAVEARKTV